MYCVSVKIVGSVVNIMGWMVCSEMVCEGCCLLAGILWACEVDGWKLEVVLYYGDFGFFGEFVYKCKDVMLMEIFL